MHEKKMKNTDGKQHFAKSLQAIGLTVVFLMVASPGESFGQTPVGSKHSAVPPPATAIAPEEVAARSSEVTNLLISFSEKFALDPEIEKIRQAFPEISRQIDLDSAETAATAGTQILKARKSAVQGIAVRKRPPIWSPDLWGHARTALPQRLGVIVRGFQTSFREYIRDPSRGLPLHAALLLVLTMTACAARRKKRQWKDSGVGVSPIVKVFDNPYSPQTIN
jgi:hypothetical protein